MTIKQRLTSLVSAIIEEAEKNEPFRASVERALGINASPSIAAKGRAEGPIRQRGGRRTPAVLDPVELARHGEGKLRAEISMLTLDQLRDIVAQYGMDPGKLVMKWKDSNRVMDKIVELALARATKGDAFREDNREILKGSDNVPTLGQVPNGINWGAEATKIMVMNNPDITEGAGGWLDPNLLTPVLNKILTIAATHTQLDTKTKKDQRLLEAIHEAERLSKHTPYRGAEGAKELAKIIENTYNKK